MCKLGCDDLFERKYVYVANGKVEGHYKTTLTPHLKDAIKAIEGNSVMNWDESKKYYKWHAEQAT